MTTEDKTPVTEEPIPSGPIEGPFHDTDNTTYTWQDLTFVMEDDSRHDASHEHPVPVWMRLKPVGVGMPVEFMVDDGQKPNVQAKSTSERKATHKTTYTIKAGSLTISHDFEDSHRYPPVVKPCGGGCKDAGGISGDLLSNIMAGIQAALPLLMSYLGNVSSGGGYPRTYPVPPTAYEPCPDAGIYGDVHVVDPAPSEASPK